MSGPSRNLRSIAVASALLASTVLVVAEEAAADPIYTDKGNFVRNDIKTSFKTPGGTPIVTPAGSTVMARERQKPGSTTAAEVEGLWAAMAASLLAALPVVIGFSLVQRHFIQGLTAGAVKS